jgi:hypothetical protein
VPAPILSAVSELSEPSRPDRLRASNDDRERVAAALHQAAAEGRLDLDELDERLSQAYAARTYADLEPLLRDLPAAGAVHVPASVPAHSPALPASRTGVAIMSGFKRAGRWTVPRKFECLAFWGSGVVDLRDAVFSEGTVTIRAVAIMGGVEVIVPEGANVSVTGLGIMGGFDHGASAVGAPGAPLIIVTGFAFWGGVAVKRRKSKRRKEIQD